MGMLFFAKAEKQRGLELVCSYTDGKVELIDKNLIGPAAITNFDQNSTLPLDCLLCTGEKSLTELKSDSLLIRLGAKSVIQSVTAGSIKVFSGSMLVCIPKESEIVITSEKSSLKVKGKLTAIVDCTSNGGFKFIPLEGKGWISADEGGTKEIKRGRLTMVIGTPSKLGNAYDIDLLLMLKSSRLISSFPTPLPTMKRISLAIYAQQMRLKGKFNALIGDAPTDENLQMWAFGKSDE
tara:strand:+ start:14244 stop:14954 length:711 start_codon:yes stop_codon:yes gene_type:complete